MIDFESHCESLKAGWIHRILNSEDSNWNFLAKAYLRTFGNEYQLCEYSFLKECHFPSTKCLPAFYRQIITSFSKSKTNIIAPETRDDILKQYIWGNRHISYYEKSTRQSISIFFPNFVAKGIHRVKDLKFNNGTIDEQFLYRTISNKSNIFREITLLRNALYKYKDIIGTHSPTCSEGTCQSTDSYSLPNKQQT